MSPTQLHIFYSRDQCCQLHKTFLLCHTSFSSSCYQSLCPTVSVQYFISYSKNITNRTVQILNCFDPYIIKFTDVSLICPEEKKLSIILSVICPGNINLLCSVCLYQWAYYTSKQPVLFPALIVLSGLAAAH